MLNVFDRGIDFADAQVGLNDIKRQGAKFIIRYSAGAASAEGHPSHNAVKWKLCGLDEIHNTVAAGLDFFANSEWTVDRVTQGYAAGHEDGVADLAFWKARGLNPGSAVYYSWDKSQPDPSGKSPHRNGIGFDATPKSNSSRTWDPTCLPTAEWLLLRP
jgi:hypothetical protein